jgi:hypothetical protein
MIIHRTYKAILIGLAITFIAAIVSFAFPNAPNYLLLPGMIVVYFVSGGVHGDSGGVHLPGLPVWYALGGSVDVIIYSGLAFLTLELRRR